MPYIKQEMRDVYDEFLNAHIEDLQEHGFPPGDVTYSVYKIVSHWFKNDSRYQTICEVRGMLAGVLSEFDRRFAFSYEDKKIEENGDVDLTTPDIQCEHLCSSTKACEVCNPLPYTEGECPRAGCLGPADCPCEDPRLDIPEAPALENYDLCVCHGGRYDCGGR